MLPWDVAFIELHKYMLPYVLGKFSCANMISGRACFACPDMMFGDGMYSRKRKTTRSTRQGKVRYLDWTGLEKRKIIIDPIGITQRAR